MWLRQQLSRDHTPAAAGPQGRCRHGLRGSKARRRHAEQRQQHVGPTEGMLKRQRFLDARNRHRLTRCNAESRCSQAGVFRLPRVWLEGGHDGQVEHMTRDTWLCTPPVPHQSIDPELLQAGIGAVVHRCADLESINRGPLSGGRRSVPSLRSSLAHNSMSARFAIAKCGL